MYYYLIVLTGSRYLPTALVPLKSNEVPRFSPDNPIAINEQFLSFLANLELRERSNSQDKPAIKLFESVDRIIQTECSEAQTSYGGVHHLVEKDCSNVDYEKSCILQRKDGYQPYSIID